MGIISTDAGTCTMDTKRVTKALDAAAKLLSGYGYCTHYPGYICEKGFTIPGVCETCIKEYLLEQAEQETEDHGGE